jgi:hypothetical protein
MVEANRLHSPTRTCCQRGRSASSSSSSSSWALYIVSGHTTADPLGGLGQLGDPAADNPVGGVLEIIVGLAPGLVVRSWGSMLISHLLGSLKDHGFCGRSHCVVGSFVRLRVFGSCGNIVMLFSVREKVVAIEC